ncbi:MAG: chaperone NapD [Candidatus Competibacteraceae bacterium]|nr:chaperone NapD [Candidatus Competibacteraceae bacterium]MCB1814663.1 chaperone NapD [Candidatus Competibacteraceae bacterium]
MSQNVHIASLVVLTQPDSWRTIHDAILALPGATVPASDPVGKLVVVLETETESDILSMTTQITAMKGVLTANLVYHQIEDAATLEEEL